MVKVIRKLNINQIMKTAFIIRGFHIINENTYCWRAPNTSIPLCKYYNFIEQNINNFIIKIVNNLDVSNTDFYFFTYESEILDQFKNIVMNKIPNCKIFIMPQNPNFKPIDLMINGLKFIKSNNISYDRYIISRMDMYYKQRISRWLPSYKENTFHYLFQEVPLPNHNYRIGDNFIIFDTNKFDSVIDIYNKCLKSPNWEQNTTFHQLIEFVYPHFSPNKIIKNNKVYDTNTARNDHLGCNPIYILVGRPYYFNDV